MVGHFAMHSGNRIRTIEILCEAKNVGIVNVAIGFDQLTAEQIELRTSKRVHVDAPVLFRNKGNSQPQQESFQWALSHFTGP